MWESLLELSVCWGWLALGYCNLGGKRRLWGRQAAVYIPGSLDTVDLCAACFAWVFHHRPTRCACTSGQCGDAIPE